MDNNTVTGIILLAGDSTRYGNQKNKNFELLENGTVLDYNLKVFLNSNLIDNIILVIREQDILEIMSILDKYEIEKKVTIVFGGQSRRESVYNALFKTNSKYVVIHDCARPFIKEEYIDKCLSAMNKFQGASIGVKAKDTIKICDDNGVVQKTTKRSNTWQVQTPQCFDRKTLLKAHNKYQYDVDITDDCMLLENEGYKVKIIEGDYTNIKITTKEDINYFKSLSKLKSKQQHNK